MFLSKGHIQNMWTVELPFVSYKLFAFFAAIVLPRSQSWILRNYTAHRSMWDDS
jgi:hypothetical protein